MHSKRIVLTPRLRRNTQQESPSPIYVEVNTLSLEYRDLYQSILKRLGTASQPPSQAQVSLGSLTQGHHWEAHLMHLPQEIARHQIGLEGDFYSLRLIRVTPSSMSAEQQQRLMGVLDAGHPMAIATESLQSTWAMIDWLTQNCDIMSLDKRDTLGSATSLLPLGWSWISYQISDRCEWGSHHTHRVVTTLTSLSKLKISLEREPPSHPLEVYVLVSVDRTGVIRQECLTSEGWRSLDDCSRDSWEQYLNHSLPELGLSAPPLAKATTPINSPDQPIPADDDVLHLLGSQDDRDLEEVTPYVVDYADVLSGLGSESSTVFTQQGEQDERLSEDELPQIAELTSPIDSVISPDEEAPEDDNNGMRAQIELQVDQLQVDLLAIQELINFEEDDESGVIDYSLSDLNNEEELKLEEPREVDLREDTSLHVVKEALKKAQGLSIDRLISTGSSSSSSLVTHQVDEQEEAEDSFIYQTINQGGGEGRAGEDEGDARARFHSSRTLNQKFKLSDSPNDSLDDLDDLPTRIDLDLSEVEQALIAEQRESITKIANASSRLEDQLLGMGETRIESIPYMDDRSELSSEDTTKLKVRDFEALTEIRSEAEVAQSPRSESIRLSSSELPTEKTPRPVHPSIPPRGATRPPLAPSSLPPQPMHEDYRNPPPSQSAISRSAYDIQRVEEGNPRDHKRRRSFSDVIRSLTSKNER